MPNNLRQLAEVPKFIGYLIAPSSLSADNTPAALSIEGFRNIEVVVGVGVGGVTFSATDKVEFKLRDGDGTVGNHAAVDAVDVVMETGETLGSNGIIRSLIAAHAAGTGKRVSYVGDGTHLSCLADFSGTHGTATPIYVAVFGYGNHLNPPL